MKRIVLVFMFLTILSYHFSVFSQDDKNRKIPVTIEEQVTPEINITNNRLKLKNAPIGRQVQIFSIIGIKIKEIKITSSDLDQALNLQRGVYIFKIDNTVKKGIVK